MALSDIAICNMALGHLGKNSQSISAFFPLEKSVEARQCSIWYDQCRREVLEAQDWSFARARLALSLHGDPPPAEWVFRYQTPADMLVDRKLWNPYTQTQTPFGNATAYPLGDLGNNTAYQLETSLDGQQLTLLTNLDSAILVYTRDQLLVQTFTPLFVNALSHYMAAKMAYAITAKQTAEDKEVKAFQSAMRSAAASDANRGQEGPLRDGYTVRARI